MRPAFRRGNLQNAGYTPTRHPADLAVGRSPRLAQAGGGERPLGAESQRARFPTASAVANSWDAALGEEIGAALGEEAAAQEVSVLLGPGLNMKRNPLCGRSFEYFSEDPYLAGKLAAGYIRGIQSKGVYVYLKHVALNDSESSRRGVNTWLNEQAAREIYLEVADKAVTAHPAGNLPDRV